MKRETKPIMNSIFNVIHGPTWGKFLNAIILHFIAKTLIGLKLIYMPVSKNSLNYSLYNNELLLIYSYWVNCYDLALYFLTEYVGTRTGKCER